MTGSHVHAVRLRIHGRVQGVGYRAWLQREAQQLGLHGFVRNRKDGSVEALLKGNPEAVDTMMGRCWVGPALSQVTQITAEDARGITPADFRVLPTV